ncbi:sulfite exporter TauE/SafE family protein [Virgibacillus oceani]
MVGFLRFRWPSKKKTSPTVKKSNDSYLGSYLLGVSLTVAFCPTMFVLFFMTLIPVVVTSSYGIILPSVFGVGTLLPLLIIIQRCNTKEKQKSWSYGAKWLVYWTR